MKERLLKISRYIISYSSIIWIGALFIISIFSTAIFDTSEISSEHVLYKKDNLLITLAFFAVIALIFYILQKKNYFEKISSKILLAILVIYTWMIGFLLVNKSNVIPTADQLYVIATASEAIQGNYVMFKPGYYMQIYPNQMGIVAFLELLYKTIGGEVYTIFQYINVIANGFIIIALYRLVEITFQKKKILNIFLFLCFGCCHLLLYSTFVYGVTLGLAFGLWAIYFELFYLKKRKWIAGLGAGIFISIAILFKNNYVIFLIAMILILLYKTVEKRRIDCVLLVLMFLFMWKGAEYIVTSYYEQQSGYEITSGMPKIMWIAMGMQDGERAQGWYNGFNYDTFWETGCNTEESSKIAKDSIKQSIRQFIDHPGYALDFYYHKFVSQWNEPTYESFWVNSVREVDSSDVIEKIYTGKINKILVEYMNLYHSLILLGTVIILLKNRNKWEIDQILLLTILLGGFMFHMMWEAKSQYIMPYFILFIPYAAAGLDAIKE